MTVLERTRPRVRTGEAAARVAGAGLLGTIAGMHLHLWSEGYRSIHVIGVLFLLNGIAGIAGALALLAVPRRLVGLVALAGAGLAAGTLAGLLVTLGPGLFGFVEAWQAPLVPESIWVEGAAIVVLGGLAGLVRRGRD